MKTQNAYSSVLKMTEKGKLYKLKGMSNCRCMGEMKNTQKC